MAQSIVDDLLWENFHRVVNMTTRELRDWHAVESAGERTEALPEQAGSELGRRVVDILAKRRADLTPDDVEVMERVVDIVVETRGPELDSALGDDDWRGRLMDLGHDPLKP